MKKIFVSKSTLDLGRNRDHRTLERNLDTPNCCPQVISRVLPDLCEYNDSCNVRIKLGRKQCVVGLNETCRTYKFNEKYKQI